AVAAAGRRRPAHGDADSVVLVEEPGQLADEVDRFLGGKPALVAVGDGVVDGVPVGVSHRIPVGVCSADGEAAGVLGLADSVDEPAEEPQLVLDDVAADGGAHVADVLEVTGAGDGATQCRHGSGGALQRAGSPRSEDRTVELVTTGLGDRADRAAAGPAV